MNITIVGGGFGGAKTALELAKHPENQITLISDKPDFQYYPALYGAATGHNHLESWVPLKEIFAGKKNVELKIDTINSINPNKKQLGAKSGQVYQYEKCVLALGSVTTYFGIKGLDTYAYGIKSADEIEHLKKHLYDDIAKNHTIDKRYVVIGAGPTGVELSAALGSYITRLCDEYSMGKCNVQVDLVEAAPRILPKMNEKTSRAVENRLKKLGVTIHAGQKVESASADSIVISGQPMDSRTIIWTSGVTNHPFYKDNAEVFAFAPGGRIAVDEYMRALDDVYVIGDNAATPYAGLAQTALHDALFVSANLQRQAHGVAMKKYEAVNPPVVVPVGENWAAFEWHWLRLHGWIASLIRRAADFVGYSDVLPLGQALGVWRASIISSDDKNFAPSDTKK